MPSPRVSIDRVLRLSSLFTRSIEIQARLDENTEYQELRGQVLEFGGMLSYLLDGETLQLWLRVEATINDRWAVFAEEAYNVGVDDGLAKRVVDDILEDESVDPRISLAAAMRALAAALARVARRLG